MKRKHAHKRKRATIQQQQRDAAFATDLLRVASLAAVDVLRTQYGWEVEQTQGFLSKWIARMDAARREVAANAAAVSAENSQL